MKKAICTLFAIIFLSTSFFAQSKKKLETTISGSTSINFYPALPSYSYLKEFFVEDENLILKFINSNSGTFMVEEGGTILVENNVKNELPSQLIGVGASVHILKGKSLFHEISLTKLSFSKSSFKREYIYTDSLGDMRNYRYGHKQRSAAFAFRYEIGKYFGKRKNQPVRFGLSGGIEHSLYFFKLTPFSSTQYPVSAKILTVEVAAIPMLSAKISKKVSLDFKLIPNILLADFGEVKTEDPSLTAKQQIGEREYNPPNINLAFSMMVKYKIKEPKKRRRRSNPESD